MTSQFPNVYWSADYKSGIEKLSDQSLRSLKQLHEVRKLVFSYMNYHHSNSEYLTKLAIDAYSLESGFRDPVENENGGDGLSTPKRQSAVLKRISASLNGASITPTRSISLAEQHYRNIQSIPSTPSTPRSKASDEYRNSNDDTEISEPEKPDINMYYAYGLHVRGASQESQISINLASVLDKEILEPLTAFLKINEPQIKKHLRDLSQRFQDYEETYNVVENLRLKYDETLRLNEISVSDPNKIEETEITQADDSFQDESNNSLTEEERETVISSTSPSPESTLESEFDFPILIGGAVEIDDPADFTKLLKKLIDSISTIRRKIPIPGYKNQIFSSNQLCEWLIRYRPFGMDPSRRNMEKFGQGLIDLKLLVGTGFFAKKFNSENMWFEWSDLAYFVAEYKSSNPGQAPQLPARSQTTPQIKLPSQRLSKIVLDEQATKFVNDTSKRFNGMFRSVKSSLMKNDYSSQLLDLEDQYNLMYLELQEIKHFLELDIFSKSHIIEGFERSRIEVVYQTLTKLLEIMYSFSLSSTSRMHKLATELIKDVNTPEHYEKDFNDLLNHFSTGIYFPSIVAPDVLTKKHYSTNQSNNNFQNIKFQFNLYKDISLQPSQGEGKSEILSISSIPQIIYQSLNLIEASEASMKELSVHWLGPINHQAYWLLKEELIEIINSFIPKDETLEVSKEILLHRDILSEVNLLFKSKHVSDVVNFFKNWLLEISDSLLPCMIYDSLVSNYGNESDGKSSNTESRRTEGVRLLSSIPRSNLSSLIFILEHISKVFGLGVLPNYGESDEISQELELNPDTLLDVVAQLNSMDQIGSVPFVHLIFRPSAVKNSSGFKPPISVYNDILFDLLNIKVRAKLLENLVTNEKNYLSKKQNEKNNLGIQKKLPATGASQSNQNQQAAPQTPSRNGSDNTPGRPLVNGVIPKSPRPVSGENFALRPFRTGTTPRPSPCSSPRHTSSEHGNGFNGGEIKVKKSRDSSTPVDDRKRSSGSTFLTPNIDIQFEE